MEPALQNDTAFIEAAFREILGRNPDLDGLAHYRRVLRDGLGRTAVLLDIMRSAEFRNKLIHVPSSLPNLRAVRPHQYREAIDRTNGSSISVFDVGSISDFDWLEEMIITHGYYEKPGVWNLNVDVDKKVMAEIVASFAPRRPLELGCAAGAVLECLEEHEVLAEGVEISAMALERASAGVRDRIHRGDLLTIDLDPDYDLVFGLDIFEHLNPNKVDSYINRLTQIARDGAFVFCNIPTFGADAVFGTVFPMYIDGWELDAAACRPFSALHVDELGYPIHGHLSWADPRWWSDRFESHGFRREMEIERAFHAKYDTYMKKRAPARRSYFVFGWHPSQHSRAAVLERISISPSRVLSNALLQ